MAIESHRELGYHSEFVFELGFGRKVFELVDVLLEPVIKSSIFILSWSLDKFGQVTPGSEFGVKRVEVLIVVFGKLHEHLFFRFDTGVRHSIVPFLREGYPFPSVHLAKDEGDF